MLNQEVILRDLEQWNELSYKISIIDIRILELIYDNKTYILDKLIKELKFIYKISYSKVTIIKKLKKLKEYGLIEIISGCPMMINEIIGIENNVKKLLIISKERYALK